MVKVGKSNGFVDSLMQKFGYSIDLIESFVLVN